MEICNRKYMFGDKFTFGLVENMSLNKGQLPTLLM